MMLLELAAAIAVNRPIYVMYLKKERQEGNENKLAEAVRLGLSNKYVVAALHARGYTFVSFASPARFVLNHLATRPTLYGVMECMEGIVDELASLHHRNRLMEKILAYQPQWKEELERWSECVAPYHDSIIALVHDEEFKANTVRFLSANIESMQESIARNFKDDDYTTTPVTPVWNMPL